MFYSDFSPRDVCQIQCTNAQNKNFKLFLVRVLAPSRGKHQARKKAKYTPSRRTSGGEGCGNGRNYTKCVFCVTLAEKMTRELRAPKPHKTLHFVRLFRVKWALRTIKTCKTQSPLSRKSRLILDVTAPEPIFLL